MVCFSGLGPAAGGPLMFSMPCMAVTTMRGHMQQHDTRSVARSISTAVKRVQDLA